jgi:predicted esterase
MGENHTYQLPVEFHYDLLAPDSSGPADALVLTLHGYGMTAKAMLNLTALLVGRNHVICSLQAPNQFYLRQGEPDPRAGYNWGTRNHGPANIRLHHAMVQAVRRQMAERFGLGPERTVLVGFSQPVGFNYRFAATFPDEVRGVIGICGGVPKDWETAEYKPVKAALLHIAREEDEFFPAPVTTGYPERLRTRAADVEFHLLPGGHRIPSKGAAIVEPWVRRILA